jgi:hypothetical protein
MVQGVNYDELQKMASGEPVSLNFMYVPDYQIRKENFHEIFVEPEKVVYSRRKHFLKTLPPKTIVEWLESIFDKMNDIFVNTIPIEYDRILSTLKEGDLWCATKFWNSDDSESLSYVSGNDNHWAFIFQRDDENFIITGMTAGDVFVMIPGYIVWKRELKLNPNNKSVGNDLTSLIPYFKQITLTILGENNQ